jgi:hypothetical protein
MVSRLLQVEWKIAAVPPYLFIECRDSRLGENWAQKTRSWRA